MQPSEAPCEIVIFPGIRIERHEQEPSIDLGHRVSKPRGRDYSATDDGRRPKKTS
jgi:hypothetical protein